MKAMFNKRTKNWYIHAPDCSAITDACVKFPDRFEDTGDIPSSLVRPTDRICDCVKEHKDYSLWLKS